MDIADALGISASAVSQMLSGRMTPNMKQLDVITRTLALDRTACAELRDFLMRIRSGDEQLRSPLNEFIKSSRIRCGLSMEQLSQVSGIKLENLMMLENKLNVQPTPNEAVRLAAIFDCNLSELWQSVPETPPAAPAAPERALYLRDGNEPYQAENGRFIKIPVICLDDLKKFNAKFDTLVDFAWRHMVEYKSNFPVGLVLVKAQGEDFNGPPVYRIMLEIAEISEWIPGMGVLCMIDDKMVMAQAAEQKGYVTLKEGGKAEKCDICFLLNAMTWESDIFAVTAADKKRNGKSDFTGTY